MTLLGKFTLLAALLCGVVLGGALPLTLQAEAAGARHGKVKQAKRSPKAKAKWKKPAKATAKVKAAKSKPAQAAKAKKPSTAKTAKKVAKKSTKAAKVDSTAATVTKKSAAAKPDTKTAAKSKPKKGKSKAVAATKNVAGKRGLHARAPGAAAVPHTVDTFDENFGDSPDDSSSVPWVMTFLLVALASGGGFFVLKQRQAHQHGRAPSNRNYTSGPAEALTSFNSLDLNEHKHPDVFAAQDTANAKALVQKNRDKAKQKARSAFQFLSSKLSNAKKDAEKASDQRDGTGDELDKVLRDNKQKSSPAPVAIADAVTNPPAAAKAVPPKPTKPEPMPAYAIPAALEQTLRADDYTPHFDDLPDQKPRHATQYGGSDLVPGRLAMTEVHMPVTHAPEPCPFDRWVEVHVAQDTWLEQERDVAGNLQDYFQMSMEDWDSIHRYWSQRFLAEQKLKRRFDDLEPALRKKYGGTAA